MVSLNQIIIAKSEIWRDNKLVYFVISHLQKDTLFNKGD